MYRYLLVDCQYYLVRQAYMLLKTKRKEKVVTYSDGRIYKNADGEEVKVAFPGYDYKELMLSVFWSMGKLIREHPARKIILLFDKSPYHRTLMVKEYKSSRVYYNEEDLKKLNWDDDPVNYFNVQSQVEFNDIKNHAKYSICKFFPALGMPVIIAKGYEADDLAYMGARNCEGLDEKIAICSVDSDWRYRINKNCDVITPKGVTITFEEMRGKVPMNWGLYEYHKYHDSFGLGHNDLNGTLTELGKSKSIDELKAAIEEGNSEYFTDMDLLKVQLKTFDIDEFSDFQEISALMTPERLDELGSITPLSKVSDRDFFGLTKNYYGKFLDTLDKSLYK